MQIIKPFKVICNHEWKRTLHLWEGLVFVDWWCPNCGGMFSESIGFSFTPNIRENYGELLTQIEKEE